MTTIDRKKLRQLHERESQRFIADHPNSAALYQRAQSSLLGGVPMNWMKKWAGAFPIFVKSAKGAHFTDVDNRDYIDLCLGDTGAMAGHSPAPVQAAVAQRYGELGGATTMLPTEDAAWVAAELARRFGPEHWSFTLSATDANRWALRMVRHITGRTRILVFSYCYHGSVDETFVIATPDGPRSRPGNTGAPVDPNWPGLARELARMNLSLNFYTQWYWKIDLYNLMHFLGLRADPHAQYEIRAYAEAMLGTMQHWVPLAHAAFVEYRMNAATIPATGLKVIQRLLAGEKVDQASSGLSPREWRELMATLGR